MNVTLLRSTGDQRTDQILCGFIGLLEAVFPGRILSMSLTGSLADGSAIAGSDLDVIVIFKGDFEDGEADRFREIRRAATLMLGRVVDTVPQSEAEVIAQSKSPAKSASHVLIYGQSIDHRVPAMSEEEITHRYMRGSFFYLGHFRGSNGPLTYPLSYPDPAGEFYGYERDGYRSLDGWTEPGVKALVGAVGMGAAVMVSIQTGRLPVTRRTCLARYRAEISDAWMPLIDEIHQAGRTEWSYRVPEAPADRARLRRLCEQVLGYENHYLHRCREYLLRHLGSSDASHQLLALDTMRRLIYPDREVADAIDSLAASADDDVRELARWLQTGERWSTSRWQ